MEIHTETIDDVLLLIEQIKRMGLPALLDEVFKKYWVGKRLSWGWTLSIWLVYILSQGDHRKLPVQTWVAALHDTLEMAIGFEIRDTDFTDDRLTLALSRLSDDDHWHEIEKKLAQHTIRVYGLQKKTVHIDATTISGHREGGEGSIWQFGHSKDNPALRQVKLMMAVAAPFGLPLAVDVVPGERADDPLYLPLIERVHSILDQGERFLVVGDCKMSAFATRAGIVELGYNYLTPLSLVGETARELENWIRTALAQGEENLQKVLINDGKEDILCASGYEFTRILSNGNFSWKERVLVAHSPAHAAAQRRDLERRLQKATDALFALTPTPGPGRRQFTEEDKLQEALAKVLVKYEVVGLLDCQFTRQVRIEEKYVGKGPGGPNRKKEVIEHVRYQVEAVTRREEAISEVAALLGWRAYATCAPATLLSFADAIREYRQEYLVERTFERLKGKYLAIAPMYVKRDDQVVGLSRLLTLAVEILTLIESVIRSRLKEKQEKIAGLFLDSAKKETDRPTAERVLQAFSHIILTRLDFEEEIVYHITPLNQTQQKVLSLLGFSPDLYSQMGRTISLSPPSPKHQLLSHPRKKGYPGKTRYSLLATVTT